MASARNVGLLLLFVLLPACASSHLSVREDGGRGRLDRRLAVAPAVLLKDVPGAIELDPFTDGLHVGHLHMSGGYVVLETDRGMQHRSKNVEPSAEEDYAAEALRWLDSAVAEVIASRRVEAAALPEIPPSALEAPVRRIRRGSEAGDLRDNQNLPRFDLEPGRLHVSRLPPLPEGTSMVLVPIVVHYYSHNGGWFLGQTYGTSGGARARVLWVIYDGETGLATRWGDVSARSLSGTMSPSRAEIEDCLIEAERRALRGLRRSLPR